jgi:hypothetical protein
MAKFARHILLAALLLRALVPLGWMPGTPVLGQAAWIICTADGGITHGDPGKEQDRHQQPCAFAAAHLMAPPVALAAAAPPLRTAARESAAVPAAISVTAAFTPQAPRAPPISS